MVTAALLALPFATPARAHLRQIAFVNHFYALLDGETAEAVKTAALLKSFGVLRVKHVNAGDGQSWTGRYLYMRNTYIELFGPGDSGDLTVGSLGIGLGGDRPGVLDEMAARLRRAGVAFEADMTRRTYVDRSVDWFKKIAPPSPPPVSAPAGVPRPPAVEIWAMEYVPGYFDVPEAGKGVSLGPQDVVSRRRYNASEYHGELLSDLAHVSFAIDRGDYLSIRPLLAAAGFDLAARADGEAARSAEASVDFTFVPKRQAGLREVGFHLNRALGSTHRETIGKSELVIGPGRTARWSFQPRQ
ncbi:hypothetical protein F9288_09880 [Sphingomonas sp. CL5.1]|uniref:DUF5829 family protein n=1 Tax=Sphingomonas sp. CL5.1 TaxID=2653203 RepID=UPI001583A92E|nr:DUF5829 family protein [Sphingomonas sp. CL5.1]QKR99912.1 hypothetical protein F9288_09880 [Sphingomonas sp. CL5.1]